jgi:hypothetical protein
MSPKPTAIDGSCGFTIPNANASPGTHSKTATAYNTGYSGGSPVSKSVTITVGSVPVITAITDSNYQTYLTSNSIMIVWGKVSVCARATLALAIATNADYYFQDNSGYYFWDQAYNQRGFQALR